MLDILKYPQQILRERSKKINDFHSSERQVFFKELKETMVSADGLGLAANQVGEAIRVMAVNHKDGVMIIANPFIYWKSWQKNQGEEGCLSFPEIFGFVNRSNTVRLFYRDEHGTLRHLKANGLLARVVQHEADHLKGVLFIDKINRYTRGEKKVPELKNLAKANEL
jgi:peptide deformylase